MADQFTSLSGQRDLGILLATMAPVLRDEEFVFCSIPQHRLSALNCSPWGLFQEDEGTTVIVTVEQAIQCNLPMATRWRMITLTVHSDLQAVGFLAVMTTALARANISVNAISAYFHDHLLVLSEQADAALACLLDLSQPNQDSDQVNP